MLEYSREAYKGCNLLIHAMIKQVIEDLRKAPLDSEIWQNAFMFIDDPIFDEYCEEIGLDPDEVNIKVDKIILERRP